MSIANADNRLGITDTVSLEIDKPLNIYEERLELLDINSPMDLSYNEKVEPIIESYLGKNKNLISRMQGVKDLYFPLFEQQLDKYELPLELK